MKRIMAMILVIALILPLFQVSAQAESSKRNQTWRFDFGAKGVEEGYIGVSANDAYSKEVGYGFADTKAVEDVPASGEGALSDAVRFKSDVPNHIFKVDLPNGVYKITVTTGDVESTTITAEGAAQLLFLTGSNAADSFTIPVTDGQLNIHAGSGVGTAFSISALEIEQTEEKPTIWACGDSTVASYYNVSADAKRGWGQYLCNYVDTDTYNIRNISVSGIRSEKLRSSYFSTVEQYGKNGDILLLAVGINDYIDELKAHPDAMDPTGYIANMTDMVRRAKAKGVTVYLVKQQGELADSKAYPLMEKKWFSDAIDEIAAAEKVGIIDLFQPWLEFCLEKTSIEAQNYYAPGENLHPNALGADKLAQIVCEQLFPSEEPGESTGEDPYKDLDMSDAVYYETQVSGGPVSNPHKGYVMTVYNPDMLYKTKHPYGIEGSMDNHAWDVVSICSGVLFWEDVNPEEGVYKWEEIDTMLEACEQAGMTYGIRIIPYTTSTGSDDNYGVEHDFVPQWVYEKGAKQKVVTYKYGDPSVQIKVPDWSDPVYIQAYKDFTKALADKYDGDPRVEYVEIRAFGNMGEWHASEFEGIDMPSVEIQKDMLDYFATVFKKTMCCVLSDARGEVYDYALSRGITKRNNGLILSPNAEWDLRPAYKANLPTMADNHSTYEIMLDEEGKLSAEYLKWTPEHYRECIEIAHLSIFALDQEGYGSYKFYREQKELIDEMANRLGYNFTVTSAKRSGNKLLVTIKNTGLAPAFFNIGLSAEITDENGNKLGTFGEPVKIEKGTFADETEKTFLFTYDGQIAPDAKICLAMYDSDNYLVEGKDPTVKFDNKNTLPNNRLLLVEAETGDESGGGNDDETEGGNDEESGGGQTGGSDSAKLRFDFGAAGVEEGYIGVAASDFYDAKTGYGFAKSEAIENVPASGEGALSDAVQFKSGTPGHVFHVDLASGVYKITVTTGDVSGSTTINAEGCPQLFFLKGNNTTESFTIPVTDGQLNIYAGSGVGGEYTLSALEIEPAEAKPTIWMAGDEVVAKRYDISEGDGTRRGWGQYLSEYVDTDKYEIRDISASGIVAKALHDSLFPTAEQYGKSGDIIVFGVGMNDYVQQYSVHKDDPDAIDPTEYKTYMTEMVRRAKAKGMKVYLVKQYGEMHDCSRYPVLTTKWFNSTLDEIAAAEQVEVIDLFQPWLEFCMEQTVRIAEKYYSEDHAHANEAGAKIFAEMVSKAMFPPAAPEDTKEDPYKDFDTSETLYYETEISGGPVVNPHKGYVMTVYSPWVFESTNAYGIGGSMENTAWNMSTICSGEPKWDELNPAEDVYDWSSIDGMLEACEKYGYTYGIRILPYSHLSGSNDNYGKDHIFVPDWVFEKGAKLDRATLISDPSVELDIPKWDDPILLEACKKFADALAEHYDGDPRVEFIDISVFGNWGEWHTSTFEGNPMPSVEIQKEMIKYYSDAFDKTWLCLTSGAYGEAYDYALSLGIPKRVNGLIASHNYEWNLRPNYKANLPVIGENFLPYKMMLEPEVYAKDIVKDYDKHYLRWTPQRFRETIEISHLSIYAFDQDSKNSYEFYREQKDLVEEMNNRLGYNFTVTSAKRNDNRLLVTIKNTGLAPAFFNIGLSAEITDEEGKKLDTFGEPVIIEKGTFADETEQTFLFTYDGQIAPDAKICLAMYDSDNYLVAGKDPTVKFDNKNTLPNNRLLLVEKETEDEAGDGSEGGNEDETGDGSEGGNDDETGNGSEGGNDDEAGGDDETGSEGGNDDETGDGSEGGNDDEAGSGSEGGNDDETGDGSEGGNDDETGSGSGSGSVSGNEIGKDEGSGDDDSSFDGEEEICEKGHTVTTIATKATLTTDGKKETKCLVCNKVTESKVIPAPATVKLSKTSYTYNKKARKPLVIVKDSKGNVISSAYYDVTYAKGRKKIGKYTVKVTFKGDYSGTKNLAFQILPPKTAIKSLKAGSKSLVLKWKKKKGITGYEIQYSTSKTFKKGTKKIRVKSAKKTSAIISKLKSGKKYYVRIRTYKKVGKKKYYSKWSKSKKISVVR